MSSTGTINAAVTNGGQVIPGGTGAAGLLTVNGNYAQTATGSLDAAFYLSAGLLLAAVGLSRFLKRPAG